MFVSSAKVHGESGVFGPTDPPCPATAYARFKVEVESALRRRAERDPGSELVVLRLPVVYGAGVKGTFDRLLHSIECGMPIPISRRPSQRSFISRRNAASALAAALDVPAGTYLPSDQRDLDVESLIQGLARRLGVRPRLVRLPGFVCTVLWRLPRIGRPLRSLTSSFLIDGSLHDWQPPQAVGCGLDQLSSWWRALSVAAPVQSARQSSQPKVRGGSNSLYDATTRSRDALQR